jgi:hypothetical protein
MWLDNRKKSRQAQKDSASDQSNAIEPLINAKEETRKPRIGSWSFVAGVW